jgi:hypothetical protein
MDCHEQWQFVDAVGAWRNGKTPDRLRPATDVSYGMIFAPGCCPGLGFASRIKREGFKRASGRRMIASAGLEKSPLFG